MNSSTPGFTVLHDLPVCSNSYPLSRWCHPTISSVTPLSFCPQSFPVSVFSNESALRIRCPQYWSFSFSISPSDEYSGLISFGIDWFHLLAVQGTLKSLLQHHSLKASVFSTHPSLWSNSHIYTWLLEKSQLWLYRPLSAKWCLCFLLHCLGLSWLFFQGASLLISWLKSLPTVILEPNKIKSVIVCIFFPHLFAMKWWDQMPWS